MAEALRAAACLALVAVAAGAAPAVAAAQTAAPTAPTAPAPAPATTPAAGGEEDVHGLSSDLLTGNGLKSPWCAHPATAAAARNCATGGLTSTGASGDNTNFDVHIDTSTWTGAPKLSEWFVSVILSILGFLWSGMVMLTRGVFVALEFAFGFNPLDASHSGSLGHDLNRQLQYVTRPLALLLAPAGGVWVLWTAAASRRHGHALKQMALSTLLITGVSIVLSNPIGTIGSLLTSSQRVGLAVISLTSGGSPGDGTARAQNGLRQMAAGVIDQPLALLEFGNVAFGTDPARTLPKLRAAAATMAARESPEKQAAVSAAQTNLDLFEIWPANSAQRNAINDDGSLLRVLCGSDTDTECKGENAAYAEFRTERGAWQRAIGLLLIVLGLIPFWIALSFCAVKIIGAAIMTVIRLIQLSFIGPLVVVGEAGNQRVIALGGDLIGGVLAAAAYSFFLGLVMTMWRIVTTWSGYGFVMQWLLLILTLWLLITHRDRLNGTAGRPGSAAMGMGGFLMRQAAFRAGLTVTRTGVRGTLGAGRLSRQWIRGGTRVAGRGLGGAARRAGQAADATARGRGAAGTAAAVAAGAAAGGVRPGGPSGSGEAGAAVSAVASVVPRPTPRQVQGARRFLGAQNGRVADVTAQVRRERAAARPALRQRAAELNGHLGAVSEALAMTTGRERRQLLKRQARLTHRHEQATRQVAVADRAARTLRDAQKAPDRDRAIRSRQLDRQAALPRGSAGKGPRRNYDQLSSVLGITPSAYRSAGAPEQLRMRADIDRQLARRGQHRQVLNAERHHRQSAPQAPAASGPPEVAAAAAQRTGSSATSTAAPRRARRAPSRRESFRQAARRRD